MFSCLICVGGTTSFSSPLPPVYSNAPQGILQCWVDVMPAGDAKAFIPEDVALPPEAEFEVKLVQPMIISFSQRQFFVRDRIPPVYVPEWVTFVFFSSAFLSRCLCCCGGDTCETACIVVCSKLVPCFRAISMSCVVGLSVRRPLVISSSISKLDRGR